MNGPRKIEGKSNAQAALELELALDDLVPRLGQVELEGLALRMTPLQRAFVLTCARNARELAKLLDRCKSANG
jgi:hypothetical protein